MTARGEILMALDTRAKARRRVNPATSAAPSAVASAAAVAPTRSGMPSADTDPLSSSRSDAICQQRRAPAVN